MVHQSCFPEIGIRLLKDLLTIILFCNVPVNEQLYRKLLKRKSQFLVYFLPPTSLFMNLHPVVMLRNFGSSGVCFFTKEYPEDVHHY